ncbi:MULTISPECIES: MoaD/ThiS family protein [unclassified Thermoactinomyces]|jgi:molybdopterin converting factor small subunit|uniref:MoaD/ThiS family protein n=1 Tax=unclassified Thermoactinomyces TaxID=2634588 RepID=UPI0018DC2BC2|nr:MULTISPECIES: MoaD/ThiS family protein [unclassified Thermoactinomyces]MBH8599615.1 MoaD/ThiS family protein [Thermoactinomyces sp. CICC 10523]MBH8605729.1 MoaD/ThiS family protein [Thermoactinomyces sp. CICC 10522]MBH8609197.1 MoaD/ThiS family protein [Thermoactinomyces sp. CICC 10521]
MSGKLCILCFANIGEKLGRWVEVPTDESLSVSELRQLLVERYPEYSYLIRTCMIAVNREYAGENTQVQAEDEVALIPFVSGG